MNVDEQKKAGVYCVNFQNQRKFAFHKMSKRWCS